MTDNVYAQPNNYAGGPEYLEPKTSVLAIFAFVISLIGLIACCIPGVGPLGLLLGVLALVLISTSGGRKKGGGLAIAAIVIGLVAGAINIALIYGMAAAGREWTGLGDIIESVEARDLAQTQSHLVSAQAQQLDQAQLDAFATALSAEYGSMQARPTGLWDQIGLVIEVGQSIEPAQAAAQREYPPSQYTPAPLAMRFDQGTVLFMIVIPTSGAQGGGQGAPIANVAFQASDGSLVWLLPTSSGTGAAAPPAQPALPGGTDPADPGDAVDPTDPVEDPAGETGGG
jgi:hypothetical protein